MNRNEIDMRSQLQRKAFPSTLFGLGEVAYLPSLLSICIGRSAVFSGLRPSSIGRDRAPGEFLCEL